MACLCATVIGCTQRPATPAESREDEVAAPSQDACQRVDAAILRFGVPPAVQFFPEPMMRSYEKDGEVTFADMRRAVVCIDLGRRDRVTRGMRFAVGPLPRRRSTDARPLDLDVLGYRTTYRPLKFGVVRVVDVSATSSVAQVLPFRNGSLATLAAGMSVSNPLYHPKKVLRVYVSGSLKQEAAAVLQRHVADHHAILSPRLDEKVDVVVFSVLRRFRGAVIMADPEDWGKAMDLGVRRVGDDSLRAFYEPR